MRRGAFDLTLYLVTDPLLVGDRRLEDVVAAAVDGGATLVQLRDKTAATGDLVRTAGRLLEVLRPRGVKLRSTTGSTWRWPRAPMACISASPTSRPPPPAGCSARTR